MAVLRVIAEEMTYIYNGDKETGVEVVRRLMDSSVRKNLMG